MPKTDQECPRPSLFPETAKLLWMIDEEETQAMAGHVMDVYWVPLRLYFLKSSLKSIAEVLDGITLKEKSADFVSGFFESRLTRPEFFIGWRTSGRRLHRYLIGGMFLYRYELIRDRNKEPGLEIPEDLEQPGEDSFQWMERERARAIVRRAARLALERSPYTEHLRLFISRKTNDWTQKWTAREFGVTLERSKRMERTGKDHFARALREVLAFDGVVNVERGLQELQAVLES